MSHDKLPSNADLLAIYAEEVPAGVDPKRLPAGVAKHLLQTARPKEDAQLTADSLILTQPRLDISQARAKVDQLPAAAPTPKPQAVSPPLPRDTSVIPKGVVANMVRHFGLLRSKQQASAKQQQSPSHKPTNPTQKSGPKK